MSLEDMALSGLGDGQPVGRASHRRAAQCDERQGPPDRCGHQGESPPAAEYDTGNDQLGITEACFRVPSLYGRDATSKGATGPRLSWLRPAPA